MIYTLQKLIKRVLVIIFLIKRSYRKKNKVALREGQILRDRHIEKIGQYTRPENNY